MKKLIIILVVALVLLSGCLEDEENIANNEYNNLLDELRVSVDSAGTHFENGDFEGGCAQYGSETDDIISFDCSRLSGELQGLCNDLQNQLSKMVGLCKSFSGDFGIIPLEEFYVL